VTVTLHLKPEVEASLLEQARASGMALEDYVLTLVEEVALSAHGGEVSTERKARIEAVRRMLEFGDRRDYDRKEAIRRIAQEANDLGVYDKFIPVDDE
jgi:hypothetical protein